MLVCKSNGCVCAVRVHLGSVLKMLMLCLLMMLSCVVLGSSVCVCVCVCACTARRHIFISSVGTLICIIRRCKEPE